MIQSGHMCEDVSTEWSIPEGCELVAAHRTNYYGSWIVVGYGYVRKIEGKLEPVYGPMRQGFIDEMIGLGSHP